MRKTVSPDADTPRGRRSFLNVMLGSGVIGLAGTVLYPLWRYLQVPPSAGPKPQTVIAGAADELSANSGKIFRFGRRPGILIRTPQSELRAFSAVCTHLECTVQYRPDLEHIWCACHNGHYNLEGINISGPPPRPLEPYDVHVKDGTVYASRRQTA